MRALPAQQSSPQPSVEARIDRIEHGLVPNSVAKGEPLPKYSVKDRMKHFRVPGLSVAFFENGKIQWVRTYGFADVEAQRAVTPDTIFQAASIAKPVVATATMRLVQENRLNLDEDVNQKLQTWKLPENGYTTRQKVTVRRLLSHTAGLGVHGFTGYAAGEPLPTVVQILDGQKPANSQSVRVEAEPGSGYSYSGGGYVVVRMLLSDVTGSNFPDLMRRLVLDPIGMSHSTFAQPLPDNMQGSAATAYQSNGQPFAGRFHIYPELGPDGLWSTPTDLARFAIEIQNEASGTSNKVLSQSTVQVMLAPVKAQHSLGFEVGDADGKAWFGHGGSNFGFFSQLYAFKQVGGQGVAIMTNGNNINLLVEYLRAVAQEYHWTGFDPEEHVLAHRPPLNLLASYVGTYEDSNSDAGKLAISAKNGRLFLDAPNMRIENEEMFPSSDQQFFIATSDAAFSFQRDPSGKITELLVKQRGSPLHAKKLH